MICTPSTFPCVTHPGIHAELEMIADGSNFVGVEKDGSFFQSFGGDSVGLESHEDREGTQKDTGIRLNRERIR